MSKIITIRKIDNSELDQLRIIKEHYGIKTNSKACLKAVEQVAIALKMAEIKKQNEES